MSGHHPLRSVREHLPHPGIHATKAEREAASEEPIPGYDDFSVAELMVEFHRHTQHQLDECEAYERSHLNREAVINKLHYMHTRQPWEGYDEMSVEEVLDRLQDADDETIKRVRDYERKFARRPNVQTEAMRLHHALHEGPPVGGPPAYRPGGGSLDNL